MNEYDDYFDDSAFQDETIDIDFDVITDDDQGYDREYELAYELEMVEREAYYSGAF